MSSVVTKFSTTSITRIPCTNPDGKQGERATIQLQAVKDDNLYGPATPDGSIRITLANEAAAAVFHRTKMGEEFIVTFQSASEWERLQQEKSPYQSVHASPGSHISGVTQTIGW